MAHTIRNAGLLVLCLLLPVTLEAQIHRWVDDAGVVHYSTTPPPEAAERERRILDRRGIEGEVIPAPISAEQREQQRLEEEQSEREQARRIAESLALEARVRQLRHAYANVDEIVEQRDRRLELVANNLALSERQAATLERDRERIAAQIGNPGASAADVERYRREVADLDRRIARERAFQDRQRLLMEEIRARADADVRDFQRLVVSPDSLRGEDPRGR